MMLIVTKYLIPKGYTGLAIFPFVFLRHNGDKKNNVFVNHEKIHLRQQLEMLIIPFFVWYFLEFFIRWMHYKNKYLAYKNISFEREAYVNEMNLDFGGNINCITVSQYLKTINTVNFIKEFF